MRLKTIGLFSLLSIVAVVFMLFTYFYGSETSKVVEEYTKKITTCSNLMTEEACYNNNYCEGVYGPTCSDCEDLEFKKCQEVKPNILARSQAKREACEGTGGQWAKNKLGEFCLCNSFVKTWDKTRGCIKK